VSHLQAGWHIPTPCRHPLLKLLRNILHTYGDQLVQYLIPLGIQDPPVALEMSNLNGHTPQEVFIVQVGHPIFEILHTRSIQMVNNRCRMGIGSDDILPRVPILPLDSTRDRYIKEMVFVAGDSWHSDIE